MAVANVQYDDPGAFSACDTMLSWLNDKPKDVFKFARDTSKWAGHGLAAMGRDNASAFSLAGQFSDAAAVFSLPSFVKDIGDVDRAWTRGDNWRLSEKVGLTALHGVGLFKIFDKVFQVSNKRLMDGLDLLRDLGSLVSGFVSTWDNYTAWSFACSADGGTSMSADKVAVLSSFRGAKLCQIVVNVTGVAATALGLYAAFYASKASAITLLTISSVGILAGIGKYTFDKRHEHAFAVMRHNEPHAAFDLSDRLKPLHGKGVVPQYTIPS